MEKIPTEQLRALRGAAETLVACLDFHQSLFGKTSSSVSTTTDDDVRAACKDLLTIFPNLGEETSQVIKRVRSKKHEHEQHEDRNGTGPDRYPRNGGY